MQWATPVPLALMSVIAVSFLSLVGVLLLGIKQSLMERILLYFVSFSTGTLLGDVFLHIIPELSNDPDFFPRSVLWILGGILLSFSIEKIIHWHHCHIYPSHEHHHPLGLLSLVGDALHNFIDGALIAGSFLVSIPLGLATTIAVVFHEIPQEIGEYALLLYSGYARSRALAWNLLSASTAVVGAVVVLMIGRNIPMVGDALLAVAAGNFLYLAGTDLIPELHKETRLQAAFLQLIFIIAGIAIMYGLKMTGS
ncbi:MAG: ZIP family metal transporter [Candidatus Peregrinibacteria bacterium]